MKRLWLEDEEISHEGRFWKMKGAFVAPKPVNGRCILVNAALSEHRKSARERRMTARYACEPRPNDDASEPMPGSPSASAEGWVSSAVSAGRVASRTRTR